MTHVFLGIALSSLILTTTAWGQTLEMPQLSEGEAAEAQPPDPPRVRTTFEDGYPSFRIGRVRLDLHGRLQTDVQRSDGMVGDARDVDVSRKRIGVEGEIGERLAFELDAELGAKHPWRDVLVDYRLLGNVVRVQAGQFKMPFSLDAMTSTANLDFVYRSQTAAQLGPGRERGIMVHGRALRRALTYELGVFVPDREGDLDDLNAPQGTTIALRLASAPFSRSSSLFEGLEVGGGFTAGRLREGFTTLEAETVLGQRLFEGGYWVNGTRQRVGMDVRWEPGPFSLAAEYMRVADERRGQGLGNDDLAPLVARGWYVSGSWLVTGEDKASNDVPRRTVLRGGPGAVELAARIERLTFGDTAIQPSASSTPAIPTCPAAGTTC
jgi:phosphate-selective porin OprO/OprP